MDMNSIAFWKIILGQYGKIKEQVVKYLPTVEKIYENL